MNTDWKEVKLQDITTVLGDGLHGTPEYDDSGEYFFINGNNLENGRIVIREATRRVNEEQYVKHRKELNDRTLMVSINGTIGNVAYYNGEKVILGKSACYFNLVEGVDKGYIRYTLSGRPFLDYLEQFATGTTIKNVSLKSMRQFPVRLPPLDEQRRIAMVLSTLDDKIELNRQMNETLEAMAQALFKSWFVDFDPVIDNALAAGNEIPEPLQARAAARQTLGDQRKPLPPEIQAQFPSSFVFTDEMGWIPEGWNSLPLDEIAHYQNGLALQKFRPEDENNFLPVVKIAQLKKGFADSEEKASPNIKRECIIDDGDVVFSWSGSLMVDIWCGGKAALNQHLFKVTSESYPLWFFYQQTKRHLEEFQRIAADKAVTMGHIKREHLSQAFCAVPDQAFLKQVSSIFETLVSRGVLNRVGARELSSVRDTLLPKLLSGELRVADAEQMAADVL